MHHVPVSSDSKSPHELDPELGTFELTQIPPVHWVRSAKATVMYSVRFI